MARTHHLFCVILLATLPCAAGEKLTDEGLRRAFEQTLYKLDASGDGSYRGANPAHRLNLEFSARGAHLQVRDSEGAHLRVRGPKAEVGFRLAGLGYGEDLRTPAPAKLAGAGTRVEYQRGGITEWYVNESGGLEQGFTLSQRPATASGGKPLAVALSVSGELRPVLSPEGDAVLLQAGQQTVLRYAGLHARDARGREVASRLEVKEREIRLVIEDGSAEYPLVVDPVVTWNQQAELTASDGAAGDNFGTSASVSGTTAVVGANNNNGGQGAAYVFVQSGGTWSQQAKLTASDGAAGDNFGGSVAVSGNIAVVGAQSKNGAQGAAYVFVQSGGTWSQQAKLTASDGATNDFFGQSVSVNGSTAVVGAYGKNSVQGAAYVFVQNGGTWSQQAKLAASDGAAGDSFGLSVSLSGELAVVGAPVKNGGQGAAYVFLQSGTTWSQQTELTASDGAVGDNFGTVAVSGATVAVGARFKTVSSNANQGAAYVFVPSGLNAGVATWSQQAKLTASDGAAGDNFGWVSVSGATVLVGASKKTNGQQGAAYVFAESGGVWSQQAKLTASDGAQGDRFGSSVSVSGSTALVGAQFKNVNSNSSQGAAYVFVELLSTTTLSAVPNPAVFGSKVTLTATVSPLSATGTVTFYDGTTMLGVAPVSNGIAAFNTTLLAAGPRSLTARYEGGGTTADASSLSPAYIETVNAHSATTFPAASGSPITVGGAPVAVAVADFNGDGKADLAVENRLDNTVTLLLGNGDGTFTPASGSPVTAGVGPNPFGLAAADFNGDGKTDLAVVNRNDGTVTVLLANGSGGFTPAKFVVVSNAQYVVAADFNGDGNADMAITVPTGVAVLLGNGSGGFAPASGSPFTIDSAGFFAVGDFNGDGNPDLAVPNGNDNTVTVLLGDGSGSFTPTGASQFAVGTTPVFVAVGDLNGDGKADLVSVNRGSNDVTVLLGNGSGGFAAASGSPISVGSSPGSVAIWDVGGDGLPDLVVSNNSSNNVSVLRGNGSGGFTQIFGGLIAVGPSPISLALADFNGDGRTDIAIVNNNGNGMTGSVTVLLGDAATQLKMTQQPSSGATGAPIGNVVVKVEDANGNSVSSFFGAVTIASNPAGVGGTVTVNAVAGVATFSNLVFSAANSYTLTASATGLPSATGSSIQILPGQTIAFRGLVNVTLGTAPFTISATASSGLPVSLASTTLAVCTVSGNTVTVVALGTCSITASQAGNANYAPASSVIRSFTVLPSGPIVVPNANANAAGGDTSGTLTGPLSFEFQTSLGSSQFPGQQMSITGLAFRAAPGTGALNVTFTGSVYLSTSPTAPNSNGTNTLMSTTLATNVGSDNTLVFSGTATLTGPACNAPGPCPFGNGIVFTTPFPFTGDVGPALLVDLKLTNFGGPGPGQFDVQDCTPTTCTANTVFAMPLGSATGGLQNSSSIIQVTYTAVASTATQLKVTQQPSNGTVGSPVGNVVVQVEDANGNLISGSTAAVTIASTPSGAGGTLTVNAVGGVATFSNLTFNAANTYTLTASATGLTSATSTSIQIAANSTPPFFTGEVSLGGGVNYLQFADSNVFGYYNFVASSILYHYDMGYEAFIPGAAADVYLFDFTSSHWLYTSSTLFPYLYDFTLNNWIYYFPDTNNPGHYTSNPRYFSNLTTGKIFTM